MTAQARAIGAVDIGGTKIAVGAIDETGSVLARLEMPTAAGEGFEPAMARVGEMLETVRAAARVDLRGIGIGCTGPVDPITGTVGLVEFLQGWQGCNPVERLADQFRVNVAMENDADAAVLAEASWGAGRGKRNFIMVTVGTGIGGGIVINGELYRGAGGAHPEIGHHVIDDSGPECSCGAHGCWEALASGPAMAARAMRDAPADYPRREQWSAHTVCELARAGDPLALRQVALEGHYLGVGIANLVTLYAPELIVLSGSVMNSADLFLPAIRALMQRNCTLVPPDRVELVVSPLGPDAPLIGAAAVWLHRCSTNKAVQPC